MPVMDGFEATRELRKRFQPTHSRQLPISATTTDLPLPHHPTPPPSHACNDAIMQDVQPSDSDSQASGFAGSPSVPLGAGQALGSPTPSLAQSASAQGASASGNGLENHSENELESMRPGSAPRPAVALRRTGSIFWGRCTCCPSIVAITANAVAGAEAQCQESGMNGFMAKPVNLPDLAFVLLKCLGEDLG